MQRWEFTPYNLVEWNKSKERILFVAAEPNGDQPNGGNYDMGEWFRTANPDNKFYNNERFFKRTEIILTGILNGKNLANAFNSFRFMDLKATSGNAKSNIKEIGNYVSDNLLKLLNILTLLTKNSACRPI